MTAHDELTALFADITPICTVAPWTEAAYKAINALLNDPNNQKTSEELIELLKNA